MPVQVNFGWAIGRTLTFGVYTAAGVQREVGTSMTETPASSGLYLGTPTTIQIGDNVIIKEGTKVRGHGEYGSGVEGSDSGVIPAGYVGDYREKDTVHLFWRTNVALDTAGTIIVYKDNNTGEVTAPTGITDTRDFDGKTGVHLCTIDLSVANSVYTKETDYIIALSGGGAGSKTINIGIGSFSIENRYQGVKFSKGDG